MDKNISFVYTYYELCNLTDSHKLRSKDLVV